MEDKTIKKELPEGEQYLTIIISEGGVEKKLHVFRNPESDPDDPNNNKPDFRANSINHSIAVWVNKKAEKQANVKVVKVVKVENVL